MVLLLHHSPLLPSSVSNRQPPFFSIRHPSTSARKALTLHSITNFSSSFFYSNLTSTLILPRLVPRATPLSDHELLQALSGVESGGEDPSHLPAVRSYENDQSRLRLIGSVGFNQAITAAAADGGDAADEHLASGTETMVVETFFPGRNGDHSTVSTRLFLPAKRVKEKAKKLTKKLGASMFSNTTTRNILARTFRQVVLQHLWSFELALYRPGTKRNMDDLANAEEVPTYFTVSSSDGKIISTIAEVICCHALDRVEKEYTGAAGSAAPRSLFGLSYKPTETVSFDSSISLCSFSDSKVLEEAKRKENNVKFVGKMSFDKKRGFKNRTWIPSSFCSQNKVGNPEFADWTNEYVPAYLIRIDASKFKDAKFQGWQKTEDNRWEALLTHYQLVELASILDMFFEDRYSIPEKVLQCRWISRYSNSSKRKISMWKKVAFALACGGVVISFGILARLYLPQFLKAAKTIDKHHVASEANLESFQTQLLKMTEVGSFCITVIEKIKKTLGRPEDIVVDRTVGAWMGELPESLRKALTAGSVETTSIYREADGELHNATSIGDNVVTRMTAGQDIGIFQVVLSIDGDIIGIHPTNRVAVDNWAVNPLAEIFSRTKLSPGFLEPGPEIPQPDKTIIIELLMSAEPGSWFVLARSVR